MGVAAHPVDGVRHALQDCLVSDARKDPTIGAIVERLAARFPDAPKSHIAGVVGQEYAQLETGRIRLYIPTLVENSARQRLHREFPSRPLES